MKTHARFLTNDWTLILAFAIAKLAIHFITVNNFELHRDAYLYYAQSEHLAWGYIAVPPFTALTGKISTLFFGNTTFALRFFPALIGAANIVLLGLTVRELGGAKKAISLAALAYLLSPAFLHSNALFQPVSFNQFFWTLFLFLTVLMIKRNNPRIWIWIGITLGIGFLNKYSIVFIGSAFIIALLLTPQRNLLGSKHFAFGLIIGLVIILPNLIWQYQHNWPVVGHMSELRSMQLVNVRYSDFLTAQVFMNFQAVLLWMGALVVLLFFKQERQFRVYALTYLLLLLFLIAGSGKPYYTLGIYPILFAFGAYLFEKYVKRYSYLVFGALVAFMVCALYFSLSYDGVPFMTAENMARKDAFRWEDGLQYDIPQDMSDMTGWKEIGMSVREIYLNLGNEKENCAVFCSHYGQAGAVMFYGKDIGIPDPISTNASFIFWSPDSLTKDYVIYVHSELNNDFNAADELPKRFEKVALVKTIDNPYFRENGTTIYLCERPHQSTRIHYQEMMKERKERYR